MRLRSSGRNSPTQPLLQRRFPYERKTWREPPGRANCRHCPGAENAMFTRGTTTLA